MTKQHSAAKSDIKTAFGFRQVEEGAKQPLVNEVFHNVAKRYDIMNDLMSGGLHRVWKNAFINWLSVPKRSPFKVLDVAGGTGDIAFRVLDASQNQADVTILDINGSMLDVGKERAAQKNFLEKLTFVEANAEHLPFPNHTFDAYTIAFGIRNVPQIDLALSEAYRVLKYGGRFMCLEFSKVDVPVLDKIYDSWSFNAIPAIGQTVTGDRDSYQYLVESIRTFPNQGTFASMMKQARFSQVAYRNYSGGIVAVHSGWKL
jgi:demethylmenaquinone methyltransferase / 2-methoxy-6-polyprenyl-1,4-benzoquinol methylase